MNQILDILRGIVIGIANIIPGVSGGTMAVSMGIYDKLIGAVTGLFRHFKDSIRLLLPLGIGMAIGIVGFGFLLKYLLANYVLATCLTFVGLILGGLPILWISLRSSLKKKPSGRLGLGEGICFLALLGVGVGMPLLQGAEGAVKQLSVDPLTLITLFALGVIASATMVIPGVSGSISVVSRRRTKVLPSAEPPPAGLVKFSTAYCVPAPLGISTTGAASLTSNKPF